MSREKGGFSQSTQSLKRWPHRPLLSHRLLTGEDLPKWPLGHGTSLDVLLSCNPNEMSSGSCLGFGFFNFTSHWLQGHPGKEHCVQLVGIYTAQWRDWDCEASTSFICEKPVKGMARKTGYFSLPTPNHEEDTVGNGIELGAHAPWQCGERRPGTPPDQT